MSKLNDQELLDAAGGGEADTLRAALEAGAMVDTADEHGNTALMVACARGQREVCRLLVEAGANIEHKNKFGMGPRDWVEWADNQREIRALLS